MPEVLMAAAEGEHALYTNTLDTLGNDDTKHRGSVIMNSGDQMYWDATDAKSSDDMWFHVLMARNDGGGNSGTSSTFINIYDNTNQFMCGYRDNGNLNFGLTFRLKTRWASSQGGGDSGNTGAFVYEFSDGEFIEFDIRVRISTGTDANDTMTVDFYLNQQLRETVVVVDAGGWLQAQRLVVTALHTNASMDTCNYQDIIVSDGVPTVGMELVTMVPAASGLYTAFTNNYTNLDEAGYDSNDLIYATAAAQRESWICTTPVFDTSDKIIYGFVAQQVVQTDLAAIVTDFKPFLRIAATIYDGAALGANNLSPLSLIHVWTENPDTLAPWIQSDFDGLEVGLLTT